MENLGIFTPGDPNFDLSQKMTEMISKWFFASFRTLPFVFLYGDQEPRSWGGRSNALPPAGGGKSRDPAGRGLIRCHHPINYVFDRPVADLWILFGRGKKFALQTVTWGDRVTSRIRQSSVRRFSPLPSDLQISERRRLRYTSHFTFPSPHCRTKSDSLSMHIVQLHSYSQETEHQMCKSMAWQKNKTQSMQLVEMLSSTQIMLRTVIFLGGAKWYVCLPIFRLGGATAHFAYT